VVSLKYDGASLALEYKKGDLKHALTKGKGGIGEDILRNVKKMKNVQEKLPSFEGHLKAEAILKFSVHEKYLKDTYDNARNGATGAIKAFDGKNAQHITLRYYGIVSDSFENPPKTETAMFTRLKELGLANVQYWLVANIEEFKKLYNDLLEQRAKFDYAIDGLVLTCNSKAVQEKYGFNHSGCPNYSIALKFPYQSRTTKIIDIEWGSSKTGAITPVAIFNPVDLGACVTRANLKNLDEMKRLQVSIGDEVLVSRRGDVIPNIEMNYTKHDNWQLDYPKTCKTCGAPTMVDGCFLRCSNDDCVDKKFFDILWWLDVLKDHFKFKGVAGERVQQMFTAGLVKEPSDLYKVTPLELQNAIENVKVKSAAVILGFQSPQYRSIPLSPFLRGLNIYGIGGSTFDAIIEAGLNTLAKITAADETTLMKVPGVGNMRAAEIRLGLYKKRDVISNLLRCVKIETVTEKTTGVTLKGKSFCLTGSLSKPRSYFEGLIKANGGTIKSVSKTLDYLLVGEDAGSKLDKAQNGYTKIIGEAEFLKMLGG
jgi:DNA ligase (NAD+)